MRRTTLGYFLSLGFLFSLLAFSAVAASEFGDWNKDHVGSPIDGAPLATLSGDDIDLGAMGPMVVVHFWATWCGPCMTELPTLAAQAKAQGMKLVLVSEDKGHADVVTAFLQHHPMDLGDAVVVLDRRFGLAKALGVATLPTTVVDVKGQEAMRMVGMGDWQGQDGRTLQTFAR